MCALADASKSYYYYMYFIIAIFYAMLISFCVFNIIQYGQTFCNVLACTRKPQSKIAYHQDIRG